MQSKVSQPKYRKDYQAPSYFINEVYLTFQLDANLTQVCSLMRIKKNTSAPCDLVLDGEQIQLIEVIINDEIFTGYTKTAEQLIIPAEKLSTLGDEFELSIRNHIAPAANTSLEGLYQSGDALCTQCEAEGFRRITYYLDRPDVLAKFTTRIEADKTLYPYLLSNGNLIDSGLLNEYQHYVVWEDPFLKPAYLFALVAGDFDLLEDKFLTRSGRSIDLQLFVDKGNLDKADFAMQSLKASMKWDETRFSLEYDLDIYMIVAVDFFNMGAMENKGLNIFNSKFVLAKRDTATDIDYQNIEAVIGHEYFHNWTGNRVTCRDWFQLSLKEGLTVFRDQEFSADMGNRSLKRINDVRLLRTVQFAEDAGPMAHPIRPDKVLEMNNFYTVTVYEKGAEIIRMLHTLLGEALFQEGMKIYIARHDGQAVTCVDFLNAMQQALINAGRKLDLSQFELWYSQAGTPEVNVVDSFDENSGVYQMTITQHIPDTNDQINKQPMMIPLVIDFYDEKGEQIAINPKGATQESYISQSKLLLVTQKSQVFTFTGLNTKPTVTFLRDFSAPIKLHYAYTHSQLLMLMQNAVNAFERWDAGQKIFSTIIKDALRSAEQGKPYVIPESLITIFKGVLLDVNLDVGLATELLTLPTVSEVIQWFDVANPLLIDKTLLSIQSQLGFALEDEFLALFHRYRLENYQINAKDAAQRGFVNLSLRYIAYGVVLDSEIKAHLNYYHQIKDCTMGEDDDSINQLSLTIIDNLVKLHFNKDNMTDRIAALNIAVQCQLPCRKELLDTFEHMYFEESLAMDKWLSAQALSRDKNVLTQVRALMNHQAFSMQNPNRIRALVGVFSQYNHQGFHANDGEGYQFLVEVLTTLNTTNPQVASRLIEPLLHFKRFGGEQSFLMKNALEALAKLDNLSKDLQEKISSALLI
ncbi:aminopeptidase N [Thorsellia kenyensis]|uniref:Aminopeptidase N n=1 Tax=Thorsellia kenyensis TaxID=1549888 RepID=A0ABV6CAK3_9GAMM